MYGSVQSGGCSPKTLNGAIGNPQSKTGSDSVQNSPSFASQVKGKKREWDDQGSDPLEREHSVKSEDADSGRFRPEQMLKSDIAKITNKGGIVDFEGAAKLVQLMQPEGADKKQELACRILLVDVIALTDRFDCLGRFVQLKGLLVLDEWLQEVHKGKIGDGSASEECDKLTEEFLFALLRALDKLPVNLHALKTCNIGKSVNHLRTHKNSEIQKKAKSLVDTWKKRVEAEMNMLDAKSSSSRGGSWPTKSAISEVSHVGSHRTGGSSEAGVKSSIIQSSASKTTPVKFCSGELVAKYSTTSHGSTKLPEPGASCTKDPISATLVGGETADLQLTMIKEEKSSSSSQSCSSDHAKTGESSFREGAWSSTGGSVNVNKMSGGVSRSRKLSNGLHGSGASVVQKEISSGRLGSSQRNMVSETPTRGTCEGGPDVPLMDNGSSPRLIVRLPNTGRSPALSSGGDSPDDPPSSTFRKASPPAHSDKLEHHDLKVKVQRDAQQATSASNTSRNLLQCRDMLPESEDVNAPSAGAFRNNLNRDGEDGEKQMEASKATCLSSRIKPKPGKSYGASFSSMNALIESCVKFSEASACASVGDDIGMNLLASVAAGEISRADVSLSSSPAACEESCFGNDVKLMPLDEDKSQSENQHNDGENGGAIADQSNSINPFGSFLHNPKPVVTNLSEDSKVASLGCEEKTAEFAAQDIIKKGDVEGEGPDQYHERQKCVATQARINSISHSKLKTRSPLFGEGANVHCTDEKATENCVVMAQEAAPSSAKVEKEANQEPPYCSSSEIPGQDKNAGHRQTSSCNLTEQKPLHVIGRKNEDTAPPSGSCDVLDMELKAEKPDEMKAGSKVVQFEKENLDIGSSAAENDSKCVPVESERKEVLSHCSVGSASHKESSVIPMQETEEQVKSSGCQSDGVEANGAEESAARANPLSISAAAGSDAAVKLDFDLNEGFPVEDGSQGELVKSSVARNSSSVHFPSPLPLSISSISGSFSASVTVASAAKGPFVPPENPLRSKGELGWKGSAATSAFRPAEPRKVLEMPLNTADATLVENSTSKQGRAFLDFDLNVPDQRVLEDLDSQNSGQVTCLESGSRDRSGGGLDLDLNRVDESPEIGQSWVCNNYRLEIPQLLSGGLSYTESNAAKGFDLNDGPGPDEVVTETVQAKSNMPFLPTVPAIRMSNTELGNFSSWFQPSNSYSALAFPSILPGRGEQSHPIVPASGSQRIVGPPTGGTPSFNPENYRGPVLSSSPAAGFPPATPFQYPGFPFETNFPFPSNSYSGSSSVHLDSSYGAPLCFPNSSTQLFGTTGVVSAHYPRPYVMRLPGGIHNVGQEGKKLGSHGLDLNAGPGGTDVRRDERLPSALRQLPVASTQALADEQVNMYQVAGGVLKRKEPDGGWDGDRISYKQSSWQ
ncbi:unnamed protein product [Ilex paraguariensis]|uniref:TFIIS N-terminal domain-containing protein n=1 Tax=Ilex paraguariensis TaxID=185542 RepID=A0ABC8T064_9AQUA